MRIAVLYAVSLILAVLTVVLSVKFTSFVRFLREFAELTNTYPRSGFPFRSFAVYFLTVLGLISAGAFSIAISSR